MVLGLRPLTRRDEGEIVLGWLQREQRLPMTVGSKWYLINLDWWKSWNAYVAHEVRKEFSGRAKILDISAILESQRMLLL